MRGKKRERVIYGFVLQYLAWYSLHILLYVTLEKIFVLLCVTLQYQCIINDSFPIIPFTTVSTLYSFNLFFSCLNKG